MSRLALAAVCAAAALAAVTVTGCSKSTTGKDSPRPTTTANAQPEVLSVPGASRSGMGPGGPAGAGSPMAAGGAPEGDSAGAPSDAFKLKPDEGQLSIEVPADAVAGKETIARVIVTPTSKYKINFEFSTVLSLQAPEGVAIEKLEQKAGGMAKAKGDAEKFEEKQLAFAVKLTPKASGSHTVNGTFKFAVCDKDTCLAKKEPIAIQVAAK